MIMADQPILYGPTFSEEILTATNGVGFPIAWSPYEIYERDKLTAQQNADLDAVIAAHDPTAQPVKTLSPDEQVMFEHENRIRTLEGQAPLSEEDFVTKLS